MGVDTRIRLPEDTRIQDVAEAIGILAGLKPKKCFLNCDSGAWSIVVDGAKARGHENIPEMALIIVEGEMVDGEKQHSAFYHYEPDCGGGRMVSVRATPFWIAIGRRLVDFFGGWMYYSDCDESRKHYNRKKPRKCNNPSDGKPWQDFQEQMFALKPITKADIDKCRQWAAYK